VYPRCAGGQLSRGGAQHADVRGRRQRARMSLRVIKRVAEIREAVSRARASGLSVGLVPTMGALHAGHGALIDRARAESGCVVVSIFVNPLQFDRKDDYERYARTLPGDLAFCRERGADVVFAPDAGEVYPKP